MINKPDFLAGPMQIDPVVLKSLMEDARPKWTQASLARAADIDASTISVILAQIGEKGSLRAQKQPIIDGLTKALGISVPDRVDSSFSKLVGRLRGTWYGAHLSRLVSGHSVDIVKTVWTINGASDVQVHFPQTGLSYTGGFVLEAQGRLVFQMFTDVEITEHSMWRFPYPVARDLSELNGHWAGLDFWQQSVTGAAILTKDREPSDTEIRQRLREIGNHNLRLDAEETGSEVEWRSSWDERPLEDALKEIKEGEEITILSTYYAADIWLNYHLSEMVKRINEFGIKGVTIRAIFLNPNNPALIIARTDILIGRDEDGFTTSVIKQRSDLEELNSQGVSVEVRYCDQWISGMSISIGRRLLAVGYLFAHISALSGPMAICRDPSSDTWKCFLNEFRELWDRNEPKEQD